METKIEGKKVCGVIDDLADKLVKDVERVEVKEEKKEKYDDSNLSTINGINIWDCRKTGQYVRNYLLKRGDVILNNNKPEKAQLVSKKDGSYISFKKEKNRKLYKTEFEAVVEFLKLNK